MTAQSNSSKDMVTMSSSRSRTYHDTAEGNSTSNGLVFDKMEPKEKYDEIELQLDSDSIRSMQNSHSSVNPLQKY